MVQLQTDHHAPPGLQPAFSTEGLCDVAVSPIDTESWITAATSAKTTYYLFEVRKGASSFILRRRYKDFDQLYANLCQSYGKQNVPVPPPKQLLKNENADFLQRRHLALQHFLRELLDEKVLSSSPELCAFLECEAAAQLAIGINHVSTCASVFYSELQREEAQRAEVGAALQQARTEKLWAYHEKEVAEHAASKAREEAARAHAGAHKARVQILKMLLAGRNQRLQQGALSKLRAYRYEPGDDLVAAEVEKSLSELAAAALEEGIAPIAESPEEEEEQQQQTAECRRDDAKDQNDQNENAPPADASLQTPRRSDEETLIKWGSLLKQGAGNRRYQGRYFELIRAAGREKAKAQNVLVYYADARKESVKGYIPLENATVEAVADEHYESIQHRLRISTPVQPLGDLLKNPKNGRSPLKVLDNMNIFQKIDTWGKSAFRSAIAISSSKGGDARKNTWMLAAETAEELEEWLLALQDYSKEDFTTPKAKSSYGPITAADVLAPPRLNLSPPRLILQPEDIY